MNRIRTLLALASLTLLSAGASYAQSLASLNWAPPTDMQIVDVGDQVTVELWALPTPDPLGSLSGFEVVIQWDPALLSFVSYQPFAEPLMLNTFTDGANGVGDLSIFDFAASLSIPVGGAHLGNLTFDTLQGGVSEISMLGSGVIELPGTPFGGETKVYRLTTLGGDFVPDYSSVATIQAGPVPEPATIAVLVIGTSLLLRKKGMRK
jgi:hypothetical protein